MKILRSILIVFLGMVGLVLLVFQGLWFPGFTRGQTVAILLDDSKMSSRALAKGIWHGGDIVADVYEQSNGFSNFSYSDAENILSLLNDIELSGQCGYAEALHDGEGWYPKLFSLFMRAKSCGTVTSSEADLLEGIIFRTNPGVESDYTKIVDYYSEIATLTIGYLGGDENFGTIEKLLMKQPTSHRGHVMGLQALVLTESHERAISLIHERILDEEFHAVDAAYHALLAMKDLEAESYARKRIMMKTGDENFLAMELEREDPVKIAGDRLPDW